VKFVVVSREQIYVIVQVLVLFLALVGEVLVFFKPHFHP